MKKVCILWFRQDLRLSDNPLVSYPMQGQEVLPIYIGDRCAPDGFERGGASCIGLYHSLLKLDELVDGNLNFYREDAVKVFEFLTTKYPVDRICWNQCYEPWLLHQEKRVETFCRDLKLSYQIFDSNYLWSPGDILKNDGLPYKVFTAYRKKAYQYSPRRCIPEKKISFLWMKDSLSENVKDWGLIPNKNWTKSIEKSWSMGPQHAQQTLEFFINHKLSGYAHWRDYPEKDQTSHLSPFLHFGAISAAQIWNAVLQWGNLNDKDVFHFLSELTWREFSRYLLFYFPSLYQDNWNPSFDHFKWVEDSPHLVRWQKGQTGYPFIDAGMRQLWQTGYMHNRVRMVVASFLVKNLGIHWHKGRDWFWDCLIDADLANNSASWQWVAGSGADAAPYFRIFNPTTQAQKFDPEGMYIRQFVPELNKMPTRYIFEPCKAPEHLLQSVGIQMGKDYPHPLIDLASSRQRALDLYRQI